MKGRIFILGLIVLLSIFIGVTIVLQQTTNPVLIKLLVQQQDILHVQQKIEARLVQTEQMLAKINDMGSARAAAGGENIEQRLASLEIKIAQVLAKIDQIKTAQPQQPKPPSEDYDSVYEIPIAHSPVKGAQGAPVMITVFNDLQCPYCAKFHPVIEEVMKAYPEKVNLVVKHFPLAFHRQAGPASKAVFAAGEQGKYWEMLGLVLQNFKDIDDAKIESLAKELKLNMKKFKSDLAANDAKYEKWIQDDINLGRQVQVRGTPTYFINGRKTRARDLNAYKQEIDQILSDASLKK